MEILKLIEREACKAKARKRFVLIGGLAINIHGISRTTADLDLMVEKSDLEFWHALLRDLGYIIFQETSAFIQSKPPRVDAWPIDLMLVDRVTMDKAVKDSTCTEDFGSGVPVASVGNLIAMKLHALKTNQLHRMQKDQGDLIALLELAKLPLSSDGFRQLCLKYGTVELYERLQSLTKP